MATPPSEGFQARKARLREAFRAQLPARLAEARARLAAIQPGAAGRDDLARLELVLHTLKGSSGSFGLLGISEGAREADELVKAALATQEPVTPDLLVTLSDLLERLAQADLEPAGTGPGQGAVQGLRRLRQVVRNLVSMQGERAAEKHLALRTEIAGRGYYVKIHRGVGWGEIVKNLLLSLIHI